MFRQPSARSALSASMVASLKTHSPWGARGNSSAVTAPYVAWHIRTSEGETKSSFSATKHRYIFNQQPSSAVFPQFLAATRNAEGRCSEVHPHSIQDMPVFISSNRRVPRRLNWRLHACCSQWDQCYMAVYCTFILRRCHRTLHRR